jgi:hypothetical protein
MRLKVHLRFKKHEKLKIYGSYRQSQHLASSFLRNYVYQLGMYQLAIFISNRRHLYAIDKHSFLTIVKKLCLSIPITYCYLCYADINVNKKMI